MKRILSSLLALLMVFSMTACQSAPEAAPAKDAKTPEAAEVTAAQTEAGEAGPRIVLNSVVDEKLRANNAVTVTFDSHAEYETALYEMGFFEYIGMRYRHFTGDNVKRLIPRELTYDGENFRYVFDYIMYDEMAQKDRPTEGWVLYGTKADTIADISGVPEEGRKSMDMFDFGVFEDYHDDYQMIDYHYFYEDAFVTNRAKFYGASGHLYNLVKIYGDQSEDYGSPRVLGDEFDAAYMEQEFANRGPVVYETYETASGYLMEVGQFTLSWGGKEETFQFRKGMSLADWVSSSLNTGSWMAGPDDSIYSANYDYVVPNSSRTVESLLTDGSYIYAAENDPGTVSSVMTKTPPDVAYAHLVDWQSPMLISGLCIAEEGQDHETYRLFDISTVTARDADIAVYLEGIDTGRIADLELYVLRDSQVVTGVLEEYGVNHHTSPLSMEAAAYELSDNAIRVPFEHLELHIAVAKFSPKAHNFLLDEATAFVITYQGSVVYWVHMPAVS